MPRVPRINIENVLYYITSRGDRDEAIFRDSNDYDAYMELLKRAKDQYKFKLFAFCLMANHLHLLLELKGDTSISQIMHSLNSGYIKYFNAKYKRSGHLFQERYKTAILEKEPYLLLAGAYIHLNPKAAGLAANIADYPYSSYQFYAKDKSGFLDMKSEIKETLGSLKGRGYAEYTGGLSEDDIKAFSRSMSKNPIMGSDPFVEKIKSAIETQKTAGKDDTKEKLSSRKFIIAGGSLILLLGIFNLYFYANALIVKERLKKEMANKDVEISKRIGEEKVKITQDLDEKYRADMVSFEAMTKRFAAEKKKSQELEEKLKASPAVKK